jgi:hypothetical protein
MSRRRSPTPNPSEHRYTEDELKRPTTTIETLKKICETLGIENIPDSRTKKPYIDLILGKNTGLESVQATADMSMLTHTSTKSARAPPPSSRGSAAKGRAGETGDNTPRHSSDDPYVKGADVKWFNDPSYLTPFLMHLRRKTVLARSKRDVNLKFCPPGRREHPIYKEYYNYDEFPMLGVDSAEMKTTVNDPRDAANIAPKLIILIGGAAVGKSYTIQQMFPNNNATHIDVDEPKMLADAMHELMTDPVSKERWKTGPGNGINQRKFIYYIIDKLIQNRDDIIIDTTGSMKEAIHYSMAQAIQQRGSLLPYTVICIAVFAPIEVALARCARRGETTLRESGSGMVYGSHNPVSGIKNGVVEPTESLLQHYAVKEKFIKKTDLFFLLDNTPGGVIAAAPGAGGSVIDGIPIPAETVVCFKYTNNPSSDVVTTQLVYISKSVTPDMNYYSCHVHQPRDEGSMTVIQPGDILRCRPKEGGNRRTRKSNQNNKQTKRKNNRCYYKTKPTRIYRRRTLKT